MATHTLSQTSKVRALYKALLRLHRGMPLELQAIGDQYVKDEFRRHKNVNKDEAEIFMTEWTNYYLTLGKQLSMKGQKQVLGMDMSPELLKCFREEQLGQLVELLKESKKPITEDNS